MEGMTLERQFVDHRREQAFLTLRVYFHRGCLFESGLCFYLGLPIVGITLLLDPTRGLS